MIHFYCAAVCADGNTTGEATCLLKKKEGVQRRDLCGEVDQLLAVPRLITVLS